MKSGHSQSTWKKKQIEDIIQTNRGHLDEINRNRLYSPRNNIQNSSVSLSSPNANGSTKYMSMSSYDNLSPNSQKDLTNPSLNFDYKAYMNGAQLKKNNEVDLFNDNDDKQITKPSKIENNNRSKHSKPENYRDIIPEREVELISERVPQKVEYVRKHRNYRSIDFNNFQQDTNEDEKKTLNMFVKFVNKLIDLDIKASQHSKLDMRFIDDAVNVDRRLTQVEDFVKDLLIQSHNKVTSIDDYVSSNKPIDNLSQKEQNMILKEKLFRLNKENGELKQENDELKRINDALKNLDMEKKGLVKDREKWENNEKYKYNSQGYQLDRDREETESDYADNARNNELNERIRPSTPNPKKMKTFSLGERSANYTGKRSNEHSLRHGNHDGYNYNESNHFHQGSNNRSNQPSTQQPQRNLFKKVNYTGVPLSRNLADKREAHKNFFKPISTITNCKSCRVSDLEKKIEKYDRSKSKSRERVIIEVDDD